MLPVIETERLLPPLKPEQREQLKQSIIERGIDNPIIFDEHGKRILDGVERYQIAIELGIKDYPFKLLPNTDELTELEIKTEIIRLNNQRRHLNTKAKQQLIDSFLLAIWTITDKWTAEILFVDAHTVKARRERLIAARQIPSVALKAKDNRTYRKKGAVWGLTAREREQAVNDLADLNDNEKPQGNITAKRLKSRASKARFIRQDTQPVKGYNPEAHICPYHTDFKDLARTAELQPQSVGLILTDPLYQKENIADYGELAKFAKVYLADGCFCVAYAGNYYLPEVMGQMGKHLTYHWLGVIVTAQTREEQGKLIVKGESNSVAQASQMISCYRSVLIYSNGKARKKDRAALDRVFTDGSEKTHHEYQQNLKAVIHWLTLFSKPNELVVDPFMGSGTTAVAARRTRRKFVGCDRSEKAYNATLKRLKEEQEQSPLGRAK